ncbi:hypothetical protein B0T25DRAFT_449947 [Lasiosphaeria hispida]|uniref:Uncharacterized protein n=1 Tax=Lasiosphaeria hispida TaxID=260671 RepID=A0AAJ0MFT3_9PEZI|nr:hypothetical protein B0T25DRAFT_449947 [Lasiosphaeria hispida]
MVTPKSLLDIYAQQTLKLHNELGVSENARRQLQAYDDWQKGRIDRNELVGRIVRVSPNMNQTVINTITECAEIMHKHERVRHCVATIQLCADILTPADKTPVVKGFPFFKLPMELRGVVYRNLWFRDQSNVRSVCIVATSKDAECTCLGYESRPHHSRENISIALGLTCRKARAEFFTFMYMFARLTFECCCDLNYHLRVNKDLLRCVTSIKVHWTGAESHLAFTNLSKARNLTRLEVVISQSTTTIPTLREIDMRRYFAVPRPIRLTETLGIDELMEIRGIKVLAVTHVGQRQGTVRSSEEDRVNLLALLSASLKLPRPALPPPTAATAVNGASNNE